MAKELNLLSYLPPFMQEYREINEIFDVVQPKLDELNIKVDWILQNQFISSCDEKGIAFFENMLDILPYSYDDLDTRITRVLFKWNDVPPYTLKYLINVLNNLYGSQNYEIVEDFSNYAFSVNFLDNFFPSDLESFYQFIYNIKPANLVFGISANSTFETEILTGVTFANSYIKTSFNVFEEFFGDIDVFSSTLLGCNYRKELFNIECNY